MHLPIRTQDLILRPLSPDDLDSHHRLYGDPDVVRFLYEEPLDRSAASAHLDVRLSPALPDEGGWLNLAIDHEDQFVGEVGVSLVSRAHRHCEIGYSLLPEATGRGWATQAAAAMVGLCFTELDAHRVVGRIEGRNVASARVLERLGMRREAHLRENEFVKGEWNDEVVYAILEDEWRRMGPPYRREPASA